MEGNRLRTMRAQGKEATSPDSKGSERKKIQQGESPAASSCHFLWSQGIGGKESDDQ